ncbi:hypothetical protein ACFFWE_25470 [Sphaerisporangium melleum]|uniref:hypothetical protein n=1 Tax=Sphaerisporangium melleum TaxID=321316 RepID=UPI00166A083E|nr:hypothetical protein [Sphaerisporangium melleum]
MTNRWVMAFLMFAVTVAGCAAPAATGARPHSGDSATSSQGVASPADVGPATASMWYGTVENADLGVTVQPAFFDLFGSWAMRPGKAPPARFDDPDRQKYQPFMAARATPVELVSFLLRVKAGELPLEVQDIQAVVSRRNGPLPPSDVIVPLALGGPDLGGELPKTVILRLDEPNAYAWTPKADEVSVEGLTPVRRFRQAGYPIPDLQDGTFLMYAVTQKCGLCQWHLLLHYEINGVAHKIRVPGAGREFLLASYPRVRQVYTADGQDEVGIVFKSSPLMCGATLTDCGRVRHPSLLGRQPDGTMLRR